MKHANILLTTKCDWNCSYCNVTEDGIRTATRGDVDRHVSYIKEMLCDYELVISGGEIGHVDTETLIHFLQSIDRKVVINTNGMFLEKGLHEVSEIRKYIKKILYHVVESPSSDDVVVLFSDVDIEISHGVVGENVDSMVDFIKKNGHVVFDYVAIDTPPNTVSVDYVDLLGGIESLSNVSRAAIERIESYSTKYNHIHRYRTLCRRISFAIDFATEKICLCAFKNKHISIDLTRDNLYRVMNGHPLMGRDNCRFCHRVCMDMDIGRVVREMLCKGIRYEA